MRPYRLRLRLSWSRLKVTRLGKGPPRALRPPARPSLGPPSSDIELMDRLLVISSIGHDCANRGPLQEGRGGCHSLSRAADCPLAPIRLEILRHGIVSGIIIPPQFP